MYVCEGQEMIMASWEGASMPKQRAEKTKSTAEHQLAEAIRRAQEQPGLADLWELTRINEEATAFMREQREASVATTVVYSASSG
jgi:hypothetical protein